MKFAFLLLVACGRSECADYATVYCNKAVQCGYVADGVVIRPSQAGCEKEARDAIAANRYTDAECSMFRASVAKLTCPEFQKLASGQ